MDGSLNTGRFPGGLKTLVGLKDLLDLLQQQEERRRPKTASSVFSSEKFYWQQLGRRRRGAQFIPRGHTRPLSGPIVRGRRPSSSEDTPSEATGPCGAPGRPCREQSLHVQVLFISKCQAQGHLSTPVSFCVF